MKVFVAYIFLIVFSFQVLPVKELGKMLFKGQMTEEVHQNCDADCDESPLAKFKGLDNNIFHIHEASVAIQTYIGAKVQTAIHTTESLPKHFIADITTPPPNC